MPQAVIRNKDTHDLYLFAHWHDYMGALSDLTRWAAGCPYARQSQRVVHSLGNYDAADVRGIIADFERALPLDILVLDMNWHMKNDWTGYTFDDTLFEIRGVRLAARQGLHVAANLHDADGINPWEAQYASAAAAMGLPTTGGGFLPHQQELRLRVGGCGLGPVEELGMDFWWIDWQQGETKKTWATDGLTAR